MELFNKATWWLCTGVALACAAQAQTYSAVTDPVGFSRVTLPAAEGPAATRRVLAVPYRRPAAFCASIASVGTGTVTFGGPDFAAGQYTNTPHYFAARTGPAVGRYFKVASHTGTTLTLETGGVNLTTLLTAKQAGEVFPAHTLGSLFGAGTVPFQTGASEATADLVRLRTAAGWSTYFHDGTAWRTPGSAEARNNVALRPDEAVFIMARGAAAVSLPLAGEVAVKAQQTAVPATGQALVGNRLPVSTTLAALGLQNVAGWISGATAATADNLLLWNGTGWDVFYCNAGTWEKVGGFGAAPAVPITPTTGFLINRQAGSTGTAAAQWPFTPAFPQQ